MFLNDFIIEKIVGVGKYGKVYKSINKTTNEIVAIKEVKIENENEGIPITTLREIILLKGIKHKNVVELLDTIIDSENNKIYLILEFMEYDLFSYFAVHPVTEKIHIKVI